jgi:tetratricopeptide (TPR) repeat protein
MKNSATQIGLIALSSFLFLTLALLFVSFAKPLLQANLLEESLQIPAADLPLNYETRLSKGDQLFENGYYKLAAAEYSIAISLEESEEEAYSKLGGAYLKMGAYADALGSFKRAYELRPSDETRVAVAVGLMRVKDFAAAKSLLEEGNVEDQATVFYLGLIEMAFGNFEEAERKIEKAADLSGNLANGLIQPFQSAFLTYKEQQGAQLITLKALLTKALIDADEYPLAEDLGLQILNEKNDYRDVWILLGYAELKMEKFMEAEDAFKQAKKLDAVKPETHYFLGLAHFEQEEYEEAVDAFELALLYDFEPEGEAYRKLAESQNKLGRYEDALAAYEYLTKIDAGDFTLFEEALRLSMEELGDLDRALTLAKEGVSSFPQNAEAYAALAAVHLSRGELEEANEAIDSAFDLDPNLAIAHYTAGLLRLAQNNKDGAQWEFKKAYELANPGDALSIEAAKQYNALNLSEQENP